MSMKQPLVYQKRNQNKYNYVTLRVILKRINNKLTT